MSAARSAAQPHSLVKGAISPTRAWERIDGATGEILQTWEQTDRAHKVEAPGTLARVYRRYWSDEWRIRCEQEQPPTVKPPEPEGPRESDTLSQRGARAVADCCDFVQETRGGFSTFLTLTFDEQRRARVMRRESVPQKITYLAGHHAWPVTVQGICALKEPMKTITDIELTASGPFSRVEWRWASSVQREVSRFFDGMQKMYARGWIPEYITGPKDPHGNRPKIPNTEKLEGRDDGLAYVWVAENPENDKGERNPHVHCLIQWRVKPRYFRAWAERIEALWGQGFAKLEKLRASESAGYYIAKAAGYLSKANKATDQGPIRGNRYGMSKCARAPGWVPVCAWQWGIMTNLIGEAREHWREKTDHHRARRDWAQRERDKTDKTDKKTRAALGEQISNARKAIKAVGVWVGKFQIVTKGAELLDRFVCWAEKRGWSREKRPPKLWAELWRIAHRDFMALKKAAAQAFSLENWADLMRDAERYEPIHPEPCYP